MHASFHLATVSETLNPLPACAALACLLSHHITANLSAIFDHTFM